MSLEAFVDFFSRLDNPDIRGFRVSGSTENSKAIYESIVTLFDKNHIGSFEELLLDGDEVSHDLAVLDGTEGKVEFVYHLSTSGYSNIYLNFDDFLSRNKKLSYGYFEKEFYILDERYYSIKSDYEPSHYRKVDQVCRLIKGLSELAHYHDGKLNNGLSLVFVNESQLGSMTPVIIRPLVTNKIVETPDIDVSIFDKLLNEREELPGISREKGVFRASIVEFLQSRYTDSVSVFDFLVQNWSDFIQLFHKNFDTYLSGFAFHKAKKEVANAELVIADNLSKIIGEITGKLLGIPLSIAALIALNKTESLFEQLILVIGILMASIIVSEMVHNQQIQLKRIKHARKISFSALEGKSSAYPEELKLQLGEAIRGLDRSESNLAYSLISFRVLSWGPAVASSTLLIFLYYSSLDILMLQSVLVGFTLSLIIAVPMTFLNDD